MLEEILKLREKSFILPEFDDRSLKELVSVLKEVRVPPGTELIREGSKADSAYFVLEGTLEVLARSADRDVVINKLGPGDTIGEVTLFCGGQRTATVRTLDECRLASLSMKDFGALLDTRPELSKKLLASASRRLRRSKLTVRVEQVFDRLDHEVVKDLENEMEWVSLEGGERLFRQGDAAESAYIVIEGRLRVIAEGVSENRSVLAEIGPGETVGEIALITDGVRAASVYAVRDSELARFTRDSFERLAEKYPRVMMYVGRLLGNRLVRTGPDAESRHKVPVTIAVIPVGENALFKDFLHKLARAVATIGPALHLNSSSVDLALESDGISHVGQSHPAGLRLEHWLNEKETSHEYVIYEADTTWTGWTERALRQGDLVLFVARSDTAKDVTTLEKQCLEHLSSKAGPRTSFVLLHPKGSGEPKNTGDWLSPRKADCHYHVREEHPGDYDRLARILTGNAVGLVLGGGGARGFAHIGFLRAMEEQGIPVDFVGGTSQGSIMGGCWAMGLNAGETHKLCSDLFHKLFDFTFPLVALITGRKIHRNLLKAFGKRNIEDLPIPYFCVSTNLTQAKEIVHREGPLHRAVRSSISLPGFMPPVCLDGDLVVDGGLLNNVPVDVMRSLCGQGKVIAIDVAPSVGAGGAYQSPSEVSGWGALFRRLNPFSAKEPIPYITNTMAMTTFVGGINSRLRRKEAGLADLYIEVPVGKWGILDFDCLEDIVQIGYEHALEVFRTEGRELMEELTTQ